MENKIELVVKQPLLELMDFCESYCVAGCCGTDAFDISEEQVSRWIAEGNQDRVRVAAALLHNLIEEVETYKQQVASDRFNATWSPTGCVTWLKEWEAALNEALKSKE